MIRTRQTIATTMSKQNLKAILVGAGYFAGFQADAWARISGVELAAIVDSVPDKAHQFAERFSVPRWYESIDAAIEQERPDFIDVATRPESHLPLTRIAARHGVHVICQKPMAPSWEECVAMVDVCDEARIRLLIHENWRWQPWYREIKRVLAAGQVGTPFQISFFWRTGDGRGSQPYAVQPYFRQMPRLLVYETLVHLLDTYRFLLGEIESLACQLARINPDIAGEDHALIQLKFASGPLGLIDANRISGPVPADVAMGTLVIEGDRASLRLSPDGRLWITEHGRSEQPLSFQPPTTGYKGDSVFATQQHLVHALRTGQPSESDGRDYLKTVAATLACYDSAQSGRAVRVDPFR
jgi:predicted dehydrogenase